MDVQIRKRQSYRFSKALVTSGFLSATQLGQQLKTVPLIFVLWKAILLKEGMMKARPFGGEKQNHPQQPWAREARQRDRWGTVLERVVTLAVLTWVSPPAASSRQLNTPSRTEPALSGKGLQAFLFQCHIFYIAPF